MTWRNRPISEPEDAPEPSASRWGGVGDEAFLVAVAISGHLTMLRVGEYDGGQLSSRGGLRSAQRRFTLGAIHGDCSHPGDGGPDALPGPDHTDTQVPTFDPRTTFARGGW